MIDDESLTWYKTTSMDIEVLPADEPKQLKLDWKLFENPVGIVAAHGRGVEGGSVKSEMWCICDCGEKWETTGWENAKQTADEHIAISDKHAQLRVDIKQYLDSREKK